MPKEKENIFVVSLYTTNTYVDFGGADLP